MLTRIFLLFIVMAITFQSHAQNEGKNMGKINLSALALKSIGVQYERQIGQRFTAAIGYSNIPKSSVPFKSFIKKQIDDPTVDIAAFKIGTSIFTPEIRYYVGKKESFHGFYIAAYGRIGAYNLEGPVNYTSTTNFTRNAYFVGKLNTITGGIMIGSNFRLSNRLYLDWWILGASIGGGNGEFITTTSLSADEQVSLKRSLDDLDLPFTKIQSSVNGSGATVKTTGSMAGVRGLGINLGIRF